MSKSTTECHPQAIGEDPDQYTLALAIEGGHRYFWFKGPDYSGGFAGDQLAVADDSGEYPYQTDDGLLFVIPDTISINHKRSRPPYRTSASIPVIDLEGNIHSIGTSIYEGFAVAKLLGSDVELSHVSHPTNTIKVSATSLYWDNPGDNIQYRKS